MSPIFSSGEEENLLQREEVRRPRDSGLANQHLGQDRQTSTLNLLEGRVCFPH